MHGILEDEDVETATSFLDLQNLHELAKSKTESFVDVQLARQNFKSSWLRISVLAVSDSTDKIFILMKDIGHQYLLQSVMEKYVYNTCDYLYYIDFPKNHSIRFAGDAISNPLPLEEDSDYTNAMQTYVEKHIAPEDLEMVKLQIQPDHILSCLDTKGFLSFTAGVIGTDGGYARKLFEYKYYDKKRQIVLLQCIDITQSYLNHQNMNEELEKANIEATTDYLTGILNRSALEKNIRTYFDNRTEPFQSAFLLIDLDNFKQVNDYLGHAMGDDVLKKVAKILTGSFRKTDIVARLGGDEFVVFIQDIPNKSAIASHAEKLLENLQFHFHTAIAEIQVSASIGVAFAPEHGDCFETLYEKADYSLYQVKKQGKDGYHIFV